MYRCRYDWTGNQVIQQPIDHNQKDEQTNEDLFTLLVYFHFHLNGNLFSFLNGKINLIC